MNQGALSIVLIYPPNDGDIVKYILGRLIFSLLTRIPNLILEKVSPLRNLS